MAEKKSTDSISISPEILHTLPMELKHGDPIYCTIPKLGWIKGRIGTQPKTQLSMVSKNGTTYQFIDLSAAPIVSLWAPWCNNNNICHCKPHLLFCSNICSNF